MEHRLTKRIPIQLEITLFHDKLCVARAQTCDLSAEGVGVRLRNAVLFVDTGLSVCVQFPAKARALCFPALVVHRCDDRLGLMFLHDDREVREALSAYLDTAPARHHPAIAPAWAPRQVQGGGRR